MVVGGAVVVVVASEKLAPQSLSFDPLVVTFAATPLSSAAKVSSSSLFSSTRPCPKLLPALPGGSSGLAASAGSVPNGSG